MNSTDFIHLFSFVLGSFIGSLFFFPESLFFPKSLKKYIRSLGGDSLEQINENLRFELEELRGILSRTGFRSILENQAKQEREIARLQAEVERGSAIVSDHVKALDALRAENEKLKQLRAAHHEIHTEDLDELRAENKRLQTLLEKWADLLCGCEPGGGATDLDPGHTCGYHAELFALEEK